MSPENTQSPEHISYPQVGDIVTLKSEQPSESDPREWVVWEVRENFFSAGKLFRDSAGDKLTGSGTLGYDQLGEVIGHLTIDEMAEAYFRQMASITFDEESKNKIRAELEKDAANQYRASQKN